VLVLLGLLVPPYLFGDDRYWLPLFTRYVALAIFALSVDLIWGYTGLLSLGQGLYFGMGAYALGYSLNCNGPLKRREHRPEPSYCRISWNTVGYRRCPGGWPADSYLAGDRRGRNPAHLGGHGVRLVTFRLRIRDVFFSIITKRWSWRRLLLSSINNLTRGASSA